MQAKYKVELTISLPTGRAIVKKFASFEKMMEFYKKLQQSKLGAYKTVWISL